MFTELTLEEQTMRGRARRRSKAEIDSYWNAIVTALILREQERAINPDMPAEVKLDGPFTSMNSAYVGKRYGLKVSCLGVKNGVPKQVRVSLDTSK